MGKSRCLVTARNDFFTGSLSSGAYQNLSYRSWHPCLVDCHSIVLVFSNRQIGSIVSEVTPIDAFTVKASVEQDPASPVPVTFFNAQGLGVPVSRDGRTVTLEPGTEVESDPVQVQFTRGSDIYVRQRTGVATSGLKWPVGNMSVAPKGEGWGAADWIDSTAPLRRLNQAKIPRPTAVLGIPAHQCVSTVIIGSSTAAGQGDTAAAPLFDAGLLQKSLYAAAIPYANAAIVGDNIRKMLRTPNFRREYLLRTRPSFVTMGLGLNDISVTGITLDQIKGRYVRALDFFWGLGFPSVVLLGHPTLAVTAADHAPVEDQAPAASSALRIATNQWLRELVHPGLLDILDVEEVAKIPDDPSRIRVDGGPWLMDATHISANGHAQIAAALLPKWQTICERLLHRPQETHSEDPLPSSSGEPTPSIQSRSSASRMITRPQQQAQGRMRVVVIGNCQTTTAADAIKFWMPNAQVDRFSGSEQLIAQQGDELRSSILSADVVLYNALSATKKDVLNIPELAARGSTKILEIPAIVFNGFHPDCVYIYNSKGPLQGPMGSYSSALCAAAFCLGLSPQRTCALFNSYVYALAEYFDEYNKSLGLLQSNLRKFNIDPEQLIKKWKNRIFMHNINHPKQFVISDTIYDFIKRNKVFDIERNITLGDALPDHLQTLPVWPLYPEIGRRIETEGSLVFRSSYTNRRDMEVSLMDLPSFVAASFEHFAQGGLETKQALESNKRVARLVQILDGEITRNI